MCDVRNPEDPMTACVPQYWVSEWIWLFCQDPGTEVFCCWHTEMGESLGELPYRGLCWQLGKLLKCGKPHLGGSMGWGSMIPVLEPSPVQSCTECGTALPVHPLPSPHTRQPYLAAFPQGPDVRTLVSFQSKAEAYLALINICYSTGL